MVFDKTLHQTDLKLLKLLYAHMYILVTRDLQYFLAITWYQSVGFAPEWCEMKRNSLPDLSKPPGTLDFDQNLDQIPYTEEKIVPRRVVCIYF